MNTTQGSGTGPVRPATPVRVVIVDDHAIFRSGLKADLDPSIHVVGEAATVEQAIAVIAQERPRWCCWTSTCPAAWAVEGAK
jgi:DNA-binding NarL/FixJ family response regulator